MKKVAKWLVGAACAAVLALGLTACGGNANGPDNSSGTDEPREGAVVPSDESGAEPEPAAFVPYDFTDSTGRTFTISEPITRVAVSGPTAQQVMLSFAPELVVELATPVDDTQAKYLGDFSALPVVGQLYGGKGAMNKEELAASQPQMLIDWGEAKGDVKADMEQLSAELGVPCVHIEANLESYDTAFRMLGELLDMADRGEAMASYCAKAYADTTAALVKLDPADRVSGIMIIEADGNIGVIAQGSYQSQVFDMCVDNIGVFESPSAKGTGNETDMEQIATWAPAYVLFAPGDLYESVATDPVWATIPAIQTGTYMEIPGEPYNWLFGPPSVNQVLGMQWLSRTLYPEAFSDSAQEVVQQYFKLFYGYDLTDAEYAAITANAQTTAVPAAA